MGRGRTDEFVDEFIDAGLDPDDAYDGALRLIAEGRFHEKIADLARQYQCEKEELAKGVTDLDIDNFINENNRKFNIGCDWEGIKEIVEYEDEKVYIPTSGHCMIKCYEKLLNREFDKTGIHEYAASPKSMKLFLIKQLVNCSCEKRHRKNCRKHETCNCLQVHTPECKKVIDETLAKLPQVVKYGRIRDKKIGFRVISEKIYKDTSKAIVLVPLGNNYFHAILSKVNYKELTKEDIKIRMEANKELIAKFRKPPSLKFKKKLPKIFAYDIETYRDGKKLIPYALGWCEIDLINKRYGPVTIIEDNDKDYIYNTLFEQITSLEDLPDEIQLFAHNGGKFDNLYAKDATNVRFVFQIANGTQIKCLKLKCNGKRIVLKDSMLFTQTGLDKSAKALGINDKKIDLDISDWTKERFKTDRSWVPYLIQDVELLAKVILKFEETLAEFGESMTKYLGLPGLSWNLINKMCLGAEQLYIPKHKSVIDFIKQATYGGRVIHWKKKIEEEYVCLDANSLYPSALATSSFPIGPARVIEDFSDFPNPKKHVHYIVECEIEAPNHEYPIHPYRREDSAVIYPTGNFTSQYTDVELKEMEKDGYEVKKYIRGIYWTKSRKIFHNFVTKLYNKRVQVGSDTALGYVLKILLNAAYGKFLEVIRSNTTFKKSRVGKEICAVQLKNGQTEYHNTLLHPIVNKPIHIGAYVLSYSRKIMNALINAVGRENIAYGDTDSIYVKKSALPKVEKYLGNGLCKFKNDYGDKVITYGIFLDIKRYFLEFSNGDKRCKFVGLNFRDVNRITDYKETDITDDVKLLYEKLHDDYHNMDLDDQKKFIKAEVKKWKRTNIDVSIDETNIKFIINPNKRADWIGEKFRAIRLNRSHDDPIYKPKYESDVEEHLKQSARLRTLEYRLYYNREGKLVLKSMFPLTYRKKINVTLNGFESSWRSDGKNIYFVQDERVFKYTDYGPGEEIEDIDVSKLTSIICCESAKYKGYELSNEELMTILRTVDRVEA